ncbi:MAG: nucleoside hydrolase [Acidobacteria bacterium]|nr:nucleoside hydrolase [Acidobacteriota bacterium]
MQAAPKELPPLGIVFDSDIGNGIDDVLALALLYGAQGREDVATVVASISLTTPSLSAAAYCEALNRFVSAVANRNIPERFRRENVGTIGLAEAGPGPSETPVLAKVLAEKDDAGEALYPSEIERVIDTADPAALIRNALTAYDDQNAIVVLTGPATNLAKVLSLNGARELITAKVKFLSVTAGAFPAGAPEYNGKTDIAAAQKLFSEWPTPIIAAGYELGKQLAYPAESIENDFNWAPRHPVVDAYRAAGTMPYDAPGGDLAAALYGSRPDADYFGLSEPGTIEVLDDGSTKFTPSSAGTHRYLTADDEQKEKIVAAYREFVAAEPAERQLPPRFKALIEAELKKEEEEKLKKEQEAQEPPK